MVIEGKYSRVARTPRWMIVVGVAIVLSLAGALGLVRATKAHLADVARATSTDAVLSPATDGVENYLLVGSDSRATSAPGDDDFASVGTEEENPGMRSDTMILVRYDTREKTVAMMSIPRDLWVRMGDTEKFNKINSAYQRGPDVLVRSVQRALNVPIHHYIEVNFSGFKRIVDAIGGVHICVDHASRDKATGFFIGRKTCKMQSGAQALGYARARHFEERIDGKWRLEGTGDIGRGARQRAFIAMLAKDAARHIARNPLDASNVLDAFSAAVTVDSGLDLLDLARKLRPVGEGTARSYTLPVDSGWAGSLFVFRLANDAQPMMAYFAGLGPPPPDVVD